jgi:hypothetical protein
LVSDPGLEGIELMFEVRERLFQISQFFGAGISNHVMLPRRGSQDEVLGPEGVRIRQCTQRIRTR